MTVTDRPTYPHVRVEGGPRERGRAYGHQARSRVERSVEAYREVFRHLAGWDWAEVRDCARTYEEPIRAFGPAYLEEVRRIAEGAGLDPLDVLAINVRTEIMYAAAARDAAVARRVGECTAFALLPAPGSDQSLVVGQNWDWLPHAFDTVVVLEADRDDGPNFVTAVEAGLLSKAGMNAHGLALATNALASEDDKGEPGVPYHVLLRAILDCDSVTAAFTTLQRARRSSSANYLVGHQDGSCLDVEAAPGDYSWLFLPDPHTGAYLHTNHFLASRFDGFDVSLFAMPDSPARLNRIRSGVDRLGPAATREAVTAVLADHAGYPNSICCHPVESDPAPEQGATVVSLVMEPASRSMWLADGPPCTTPCRHLDYRDLLADPLGAPTPEETLVP